MVPRYVLQPLFSEKSQVLIIHQAMKLERKEKEDILRILKNFRIFLINNHILINVISHKFLAIFWVKHARIFCHKVHSL
jgi:hypothetical protein